MKADPSLPAAPSWDSAVLVCKECRKRRNGPKGLKNAQAVHAAKQALRSVKPRPRVLLTSCLGLCPKAALAIARVGGSTGPRIVAVPSVAEVEDMLTALAR